MDYSSLSGVPRFLTRPKAFMVSVGKDATLSCQIIGNPIPVVSWEKDKLPVQSGGRFKTTEDGDLYRLTIYDLNLEDSGQYICRAKNTIGEAFAAVSIKVGEETTVTEFAPYFIQKPSNIKVTLGEDAMFKCKVQGSPPLSVNWEKDGRYLRNKADAGRFQIESAGESNALTIQCARLGDSGTYTCRAENLLGSAKPSIPFKAKLRDLEVREKESATFQCEVPVAATETAWFKEETKLQQSKKYNIEEEGTYRRLTVQNVTADDDAVYICEMKEGSRTIAELSVQGNIIKKLPRKTAIFVNDTATFCVELDSDCQDVRWLKNKEEVKPSDRISITRSGKQHTMTIRECKVEDAGEIAFLADESRTSTQFTVTTPKKPPTQAPADPVVKNKTETSVTLAWSPPRMDRPIPIDGYIVERKKLTGFTWVRCHESHVPVPELTVSHLPEEADYQFRVSAVNAYGQSPFLEFPGSLHLEPILAVRTPLTAAEVAPGGDALFTVDLTKVCSGTWYLNGKVLQESETHIIQRTQTTHTLIIKNVTKKDDGAEVRFVANDIDTSTKMRVKGIYCSSLSFLLPVKGWLLGPDDGNWGWGLSLVCGKHLELCHKVTQQDQGSYTCETKDDRTTFQVKVREPEVVFTNKEKVQKEVKAALSENATLSCEVAQEKMEVKWYKDGKLITSSKKFKVESKGKSRRLVVSEVEKKDAGEYTCEAAAEDAFINKDKVKKEVKAALSENATLSCEVAQEKTEVKWYKDGKLITSSKKFKVESEGKSRHLVVSEVEKKDAGEYTCEAEDAFVHKEKVQKEVKAALSENATLSCEVAQEKTEVKWCKDGKLITTSKKFKVESEGKSRRLVVGEVEKKDAGQYTCEAAGQKLTFRIDVTGERKLFTASMCRALLCCEVAQEKTEVKWYKDGKLITSSKKFKVESEGKSRRLVVSEVEKKDAGEYTCEAAGQKLTFRINVPGRKRLFSPSFLFLESLEKLTLFHNFFCVTLQIFWRTTLAWPDFDGCKSTLYFGETLNFSLFPEPEVVFTNKEKVQKEVKAALSENATLSCEVAQEKTEVKWYKDGKLITSSKKFKVESEGKSRRLVVGEVEKKDAGEYTCEADDKQEFRQVSYLFPSRHFAFSWISEVPVKFAKKLEAVKEGREAVFKCTVTPGDAVVTWLRNGTKIEASKKYVISQKDTSHSLTITDLTLEDAAEITASAEGVESTANLRVREASISFKKKLEPRTVEERETVTLEVELTKASEVKWMRNSIVLKPSDKIEIKAEGTKHTLVVKDISFADRGFYCCESTDDKTQAKINVESEFGDPQFHKEEKKKKLGRVWRWILNVFLSNFLSEGVLGKLSASSLVLPLCPFPTFFRHDCHRLGYFTAVGVRSPSLPWYFPVRQIKLVRGLQPMEVAEKGTVTFEVEVSHEDVEGTWQKDGVRLKPAPNVSFGLLGKKHSLTLSSVALEDAGLISFKAEGINTSGRLTVTEQAINIVKELNDEDVTEPEEANFECETSIPSVKPAKWFLKGAALQAGRNIIMQQEGTIHRLTIIKTSVDMTGTIQFSIGKSKSTANLLQHCMKMEDKTVLERHSVILSCDFRPSPKHVRWFKGQELIEPSDKYRIKRDQYSAELKIMKVKPEDAGVYKCQAGIAETEAMLSVEGTGDFQQQDWPGAGFMVFSFTLGSSSQGEADCYSYLLILYKCSVTSKLLIP
uniref:Obscurin n=1 Tax=Malurus cyaneus samueli TaxID=2593467 RepID=A0A8C5TZE1_9PASS